MLIHIINGTYGHNVNGYIQPKTPNDEPFEVSGSEARRLVAMGIAERVETAPSIPTAPASETDRASEGSNTHEPEEPAEGKKTALSGLALDECIEIDESGHMTEQSLMQMTRANMEALAADLGVDAARCKNKAEISALLAQVEIGLAAQADEEPPVIGAAMPE